MDTLVGPEVINEQAKELRKIVEDLIIVENGKILPKPGVTKQQLAFAIQQLSQIKAEFELMETRRIVFNKDLDEHQKVYDRARSGASRLEAKYGESFFPKWYRKFLNM